MSDELQHLNTGDSTKAIGDRQGYFYFSCLQALFTRGTEDFGKDTARRADFVSNNQHLFAGTVLCAMFAFLESNLGGKSNDGATWVTRYGGRAEDELKCLRLVRNAFVHSNGRIGDLKSATENDKNALRGFIEKLEAGEVKDDKGNQYPVYMTLTDDEEVVLNEHAIRVFTSLGKALSH